MKGGAGVTKKPGAPRDEAPGIDTEVGFATADQAAVPASVFGVGRFLSPLNVRKITSHSGELTP